MGTEKSKAEKVEQSVEQSVESQFSRDEWVFIAQCVSESTIKAKDAATVANILIKLKEKCK